MKKIVTICLIICTVFGLAFATGSALDSDEVKVRTKVGQISVNDAIQDALENGNHLYNLFVSTKSAEDASSKDVTSSVDPTENDVIAYFRVFQEGRTKTAETVTLSFAAGPLQLNGMGTAADESTPVPVISNAVGTTKYSYLTVTPSAIAGNSFTYAIAYSKMNNAFVSVENEDIGTFKATWAKTEGLKDGDYVASISMILTAN